MKVGHRLFQGFSAFSETCALLLAVLAGVTGCAKLNTSGQAVGDSCTALSGTPWEPNVSGAAASNHDSSVTVATTVVEKSGPITGAEQAVPNSQEISVAIPMLQDLGAQGSLSLVAEVSNVPSKVKGLVFPFLVSLNDGVNELVNLARSGTGGDCAAAGFYSCSADGCYPNPNCVVKSPSAFTSTSQWLDHQIPFFGQASVNIFPTCNWEGGVEGTVNPSCAFNSANFFVGGKLRTGGFYTAKYVLLSSASATVPPGYNADLKVTAFKKTDNAAGGAIDLNLIIVGDQNIQDSRTDKGKQNLDALLEAVQGHFNQANLGVKIGKINAIEWGCPEGGQSFADISDLDQDLGAMFKLGTSLLPAETQGKALNVYLVSSVGQSGVLTILGLSAAIGGPMINGLETSGLVFASQEQLANFNPNCVPGIPCPITAQEADFVDMGITMAHEMGHYLGLNHPSESDGSTHDGILDTPICTATSSTSAGPRITFQSCRITDPNHYLGDPSEKTCKQACPTYSSSNGDFCPDKIECQFNHLMWWMSKNFKEIEGTGDGNIISPQSATIVNYNPFIQ